MLPEMFLIRNVILACWVIFSTLYMGKSSGKQDLYDLRHSDERGWSSSSQCSFVDITKFTCILIL